VAGSAFDILFRVPLSCFRHSSNHPNPLAIPWDAWTKGVFFLKGEYGDFRETNGGRVIDLTHPSDSLYTVSLLDLNRYRAVALGRPNGDSPPDDDPSSDPTKSDVFPLGEIRVERRAPAHVTSRSFSLKGYSPSFLLCEDEHIIIWTVCFHIYICFSSFVVELHSLIRLKT
jgi:hypothetical protein